MAIVIDEQLTASPTRVGLPSKSVVLRQTLHSDLGGESATLTYSLSKAHNVSFEVAGGPVKQIELEIQVPGNATERPDTVQLMEIGGGTEMAQVTIKMSIAGEDNTVNGSVTLAIQQD